MADGSGYSLQADPIEPMPDATALWCDEGPWLEADLPRRQWIAPGYLLRGAVTVLIGPGGVSKSSIVLAYAAALAVAAPFSGFSPAGVFRSIVYNVEDDAIEQRRRLSVIAGTFGASPSTIGPLIMRVGPNRTGSLLARDPETRRIAATPAMTELRGKIATHRADVLFVDPLAELHDCDENDNTAIRAVMAEFRALAVDFNIAVLIVHHTRKGLLIPGDAEAARGASSILGAARVVLTATHMTAEDEKGFGLLADSRRHYFRIDGGKSNHAVLTGCEWFERSARQLEPNGDYVAAPVPWHPPTDVITPEVRMRLESLIELGSSQGPWSPQIVRDNPRSIRQAMVEVGVTTIEGQRKILDQLLTAGFSSCHFKDKGRKKARGLRAPSGKPAADWVDD